MAPSVPAGMHQTNSTIKVTAHGTASGAKVHKTYFGSTAVTLSADTTSSLWEANLTIQLYGAISQRIFGEFRQDGTVVPITPVTATEAIANALALKFSGTVPSGTITMYNAT